MSTPHHSEGAWSAPTPADPEQDRREVRRALAPVAASLAAFVVATYTVPVNGRPVDEVVLAAIVGLVVLAGRFGGRGAAISAALMGAFSFDFFHVEPLRVLHTRTLLLTLALFGLVAVAAGRRGWAAAS